MRGVAQAREERGRGIHLTDVERVMRHYSIDSATAEYWLTIHPVDILLPELGYGLGTDGTDNQFPWLWPIIFFSTLSSMIVGGIIKKLGR